MSVQTWSIPTGHRVDRHATELLESPRAPSFFFAGPSRTLVAQDEGDAFRHVMTDPSGLIDAADRRVRESSRDGGALLAGAIPFSERSEAHMFCTRQIVRAGRWWVSSTPHSAPLPLESTVVGDARREEEHFRAAVREAAAAIRRGELSKVVLCRMKQLVLGGRPSWKHLLEALRAKNPHGFVFALSLPEAPATGTVSPPSAPSHATSPLLVGASPELLLSRRGRTVVSAPLAGSIPRSLDLEEDRRRALELTRSAKDRHEHRLVVEQILESLLPYTTNLRFEREPSVTATSAMWHLSTRIEGTLTDLDVSALRLALALHPTPAICGTPTRDARAWIERTEQFDRGFFTGTLGHMDARGDGDWIVTIRCAKLSENRVSVYAGAGIVGSSVDELELRETDAKMRTMLDALGVEQSS